MTCTSHLAYFVYCYCNIADQYSAALGNGLASLVFECTAVRPVVFIPVWVYICLLYSLPSLWLSVLCFCCHMLSFQVPPYNCVMWKMWVALYMWGMSYNRSGYNVSVMTAAVEKLWVDTRLGLTLSLLMPYTYGAPCKARNFNVVYIWTLRLATLKAVSFSLLHNVSTLNQCRKLSCGTVVRKYFASYQG
jgi:hypothetical protein